MRKRKRGRGSLRLRRGSMLRRRRRRRRSIINMRWRDWIAMRRGRLKSLRAEVFGLQSTEL
eukprot:7752370-Pyramimonas_sp.AAC.1